MRASSRGLQQAGNIGRKSEACSRKMEGWPRCAPLLMWFAAAQLPCVAQEPDRKLSRHGQEPPALTSRACGPA